MAQNKEKPHNWMLNPAYHDVFKCSPMAQLKKQEEAYIFLRNAQHVGAESPGDSVILRFSCCYILFFFDESFWQKDYAYEFAEILKEDIEGEAPFGLISSIDEMEKQYGDKNPILRAVFEDYEECIS